MKIPNKLKIGGHTVEVKLVDNIEGGNLGLWDPKENLIVLDKTQPASQIEVTLIHEVLHAVNILTDHEKLEYLSQALYQVIVDNKLHFTGKDDK